MARRDTRSFAGNRLPDFDTTADMGRVPDVSVTSSGKNLVHRIWCTGAGEGEGTARAHAEILSSVLAARPALC